MKQKITLMLMLVTIFSSMFSQTTEVNTSKEWLNLLENQKSTLQNADAEVLLVDGCIWQRYYGEKEYILMPRFLDLNAYRSRIQKLDDKTTNTFKSKSHIIEIEIRELTKTLLKKVDINIANYVVGKVKVCLPEIDIDMFNQANISITYLNNYGKTPKNNDIIALKTQSPTAVIFTEGFETVGSTIPGSVYSSTIIGSTNCGWSDVSCIAYNGNWSAWCAGNGGACNACGNDYVNDMNTEFLKSTDISTSAFQNLDFTFWMNHDLYSPGTNDELRIYYKLSGSWSLNSVFNSSATFDGAGWKQYITNFPGIQTNFSFGFGFMSNSIGFSEGIYLDDLQLNGTPIATNLNTSINNLSPVKIYPNPNNGNFSIESQNDITLTITNQLGQLVETILLADSNKHQIAIDNLPNGIYFITGNNGKEFINQKIIVAK